MLTFVSCNDDAPVFLRICLTNSRKNNKLTIVNCKDLSAQLRLKEEKA